MEHGDGFLSALLDSSRDLVFVKNRDSRIIWANRAFHEFSGVAPGSLGADSPAPAEFQELYREADRRVFAAGETVETPEEPSRRQDGRLRWLHTVKTPLKGPDGRVDRLVVVARDVTEAREARLMLERINDCLLGFGPDPVENVSRLTALCGNLLGADAAAYHRLDKGVFSAVGRWNLPEDFDDVAPSGATIWDEALSRDGGESAALRPLPAGWIARRPEGRAFESFAARGVRFGGRPLGVLCALFPAGSQPAASPERVLGMIAGAIAVEEERARGEKTRARMAEELRQAQKMEAIGRLAGGIAHDFNNTLTTIKGYAEILRDASATESGREDAGEILRSVDYAASLTRQLLAFSRRQVLLPRVVDLNETVRGLARMLRRLLGEHVALETRLCDGEMRLFADPSQLEQILMNLALNARDAMPEGGRLLVETAPAPALEAAPGSFVRLTVSDTGTGISAELLPRIFEPFFTTKEQGKGTGLGLATVYGIVTQSGGRVECESAPGRGTTFKVYLPLTGRRPAPPTQRTLGALAGKGFILLVEDDPGIRGMAQRVLQNAGYEVAAAASADEALRLSEALGRAVDALVTDVVMPGLNGRQLAQRLERARPGLKVVYMSGYTDDDSLRGALQAGGAFLQKPFNPSDLCRVLKDVLAGAA